MKTIFHILKRDLLRLVKTPAAMVVVLAMIVLPSLYTWYNVLGFWDPYANTGKLKVVVVNEDRGGTTDLTGELHVGDTILATLQDNDQLDWVFTNREEGMERLAAGEVYAVFVSPGDFTSNLLSLTTGNFTKPAITYYVNEKTGPVAPKITNAGAGVLESTINSTFVSTVSQVIVDVLGGVLEESDTLDGKVSQGVLDDIGLTRELIADTYRSLADISALTADIRGNIPAARDALAAGKAALGRLDGALSGVTTDADLAEKGSRVVMERMQAAVDQLHVVLGALAGQIPDLDPTSQGQLQAIAASLEDLAGALAQSASQALVSGLGDVSMAADALKLSVHAQELMVDQAQGTLDHLTATLNLLDGAVASTTDVLGSVDADLQRMQAILETANATSVLSTLVSDSGLDLEKVSSFLGSPTRVETEALYPLNAYGSAMAPLFMNLTFWIGAFMLLVIIRTEPDEEGIHRMTVAQRYLGRLLFMLPIALLQAVVCCAGALAIGCQAASVPALFLAAMFSSWAYLSVIFCLVMTMRHVGKAIAIIMAFIQIPGATGLYPVEMTSPFFQTVFRFLPFTYGIKALREAIFGFYGSQFGQALAILAFIAIVATLVGIVATGPLANVNRLFAREMRESGVYNDEAVVMRRESLSWERFARSLSARDVEELKEKAARAERVYPVAVRVALIGGVLVPVAATAIFALTAAEKTVVLTAWLVWVTAVCLTMVFVENWRQRAVAAFAEVSGVALDDSRLGEGTTCVNETEAGKAEAEIGEVKAGEGVAGETEALDAGKAEATPDPAGCEADALSVSDNGAADCDADVQDGNAKAAPDTQGPHYAVCRPGYTSIIGFTDATAGEVSHA